MISDTWSKYPVANSNILARQWLDIQVSLGLAPNTLDAYGRALNDYLSFCQQQNLEPLTAGREHIALYVNYLLTKTVPPSKQRRQTAATGLSNATIQQRLTAVRLFYDYLIEEGHRETNPVGRGRFTPGNSHAGAYKRGLVPRQSKLPWIPDDDEWQRILQAAQEEPLRNRFMLALAYDAALRREELCVLETSDIDPGRQVLTIRAETTKNRRGRVVPYSDVTSTLLASYLQQRREFGRKRGPLFLSESRRNAGQPISKWSWSKVIQGISQRSEVPEFSTHTMRHLRLTDLARSDWDIHEIATFAGHRNIESTMLYIHLSGRDLAHKIKASMDSIHAWRIQMMVEALT